MRCTTLVMVSLFAAVGTVACGDDNGTGPPSGLQPEALAVSPDSGNVGTRVEITGSNFEQGAGVAFDDIPSGTVEFVDASTLLAHAPQGLEADSLYDVTVINPGGKSDALADAYKAVGPALLVESLPYKVRESKRKAFTVSCPIGKIQLRFRLKDPAVPGGPCLRIAKPSF